ncbi:MAG: hypothetical protein F6K26_53320 [Moorea sp. SIO2I5]|nr:hypothetical protein [Moorena sp. SIO2I5]
MPDTSAQKPTRTASKQAQLMPAKEPGLVGVRVASGKARIATDNPRAIGRRPRYANEIIKCY